MPLDDVVEVSNYVAAMEQGLSRLRGEFPLSNRLVREIHGVLLSRGRGSGKDPGEFRRSQNWVGGSRPGNAAFVPPPHTAVSDCMTAKEDRGRIDATGRRAGSAVRVHDALKARPILSMPEVCHATGLSFPAASSRWTC